jgi:His/Glu/Gln/Arg/opine family amino acid ABC transporter permease subunit
MSKKQIITLVVSIVVVIALIGLAVWQINSSTRANDITPETAEAFVNSEFDKLASTNLTTKIADVTTIKVNGIDYGSEKDIILECTVETLDVYSSIKPYFNNFLSAKARKESTGMVKSALNFKLEFEPLITELIDSAETITTDFTVCLYETADGLMLFADDASCDAVYGGILSLIKDMSATNTYENDKGNEVEVESPNVNKGFNQCFELRRNIHKPDTSNYIGRLYNDLKRDFYRNFIEHDRYKTIFTGLWVTIKLTICALIIGIFLGFIVAFIRCTFLKTTKPFFLLRILNAISQVYLTVIRGTPVVVQIMIIYFVILMPLGVDKFTAAVTCFGLNSGAYVAEIVRGGIMSVDNGQTEAGRSLGFGYMATMYHIVFPQAFKTVLPALANEFVVLLKETSIAFYIGLGDLMYAGNAIRAATYSAFMPLVSVGIIYLVMVLILSKLVSLLERRLRNNER